MKAQGLNSAAGPNRHTNQMAHGRQLYANSEMINKDSGQEEDDANGFEYLNNDGSGPRVQRHKDGRISSLPPVDAHSSAREDGGTSSGLGRLKESKSALYVEANEFSGQGSRAALSKKGSKQSIGAHRTQDLMA